jgi:hypothetical protein
MAAAISYPYPHINWSPTEKKIARKAFDKAYEAQCAAIRAHALDLLSKASTPSDLWQVEDYLYAERRETTTGILFFSMYFLFCSRKVGYRRPTWPAFVTTKSKQLRSGQDSIAEWLDALRRSRMRLLGLLLHRLADSRYVRSGSFLWN